MIRHRFPENVYERALMRIRWLWDEFGNIAVSMSGGKDSTVILELALIVARERGVDRVPVMWLDQECEYQATVDYMREVMHRPEVEPFWLQVPFRLFNSTQHQGDDQWLHVWGPDDEPVWMRPREPDSIHENVYGTDRFASLLHAVADHHFPGHAVLTGLRIEESPARMLALTGMPKYKWITWGRRNKHHINFAPLYDWTWRDIWKAIHDGDWTYNRHYDAQWRYGVKVLDMRVSNFHHETAVSNLWSLQEIEPDTYQRATQRLQGLQTAATLGRTDWQVYDLPFMFDSWTEYRDYLLDHLVDPELRPTFAKRFASMETELPYSMTDPKARLSLIKAQVRSVIANDWEFVKLDNAILSVPKEHRLLNRQGITYEAAQEAHSAI